MPEANHSDGISLCGKTHLNCGQNHSLDRVSRAGDSGEGVLSTSTRVLTASDSGARCYVTNSPKFL